jgi:hypothetical protein
MDGSFLKGSGKRIPTTENEENKSGIRKLSKGLVIAG